MIHNPLLHFKNLKLEYLLDEMILKKIEVGNVSIE
jgi:hypothetical protein